MQVEVLKKKAELEKKANTSYWSWNSTNQAKIQATTSIRKHDSVIDSTNVFTSELVIPQARLDQIDTNDQERQTLWFELLKENQKARKLLKGEPASDSITKF